MEQAVDAKKIVIIDDEEDVVMYLAAILADNGFEVATATDGREGIRLVQEIRPDLVCLDILMPGETGFSLYRKIKEDMNLGTMPVLIISGMSYEQGGESGARSELDDLPAPDHYIEKPVQPEKFLKTVRTIIG